MKRILKLSLVAALATCSLYANTSNAYEEDMGKAKVTGTFGFGSNDFSTLTTTGDTKFTDIKHLSGEAIIPFNNFRDNTGGWYFKGEAEIANGSFDALDTGVTYGVDKDTVQLGAGLGVMLNIENNFFVEAEASLGMLSQDMDYSLAKYEIEENYAKGGLGLYFKPQSNPNLVVGIKYESLRLISDPAATVTIKATNTSTKVSGSYSQQIVTIPVEYKYNDKLGIVGGFKFTSTDAFDIYEEKERTVFGGVSYRF